MPSVGFVSLGCAKNVVDSQVLAGRLVAEGLRLAPAPEQAEAVIVNTCAFIAEAREESLAHIRAVCAWKRRGPCRAVLVAGCLAQRYRDELRGTLPGVDAFIGLDDLDKVAAVVRRLAAGERGILEVSAVARGLFEPPVPGLVFSAGRYAYLRIGEGCNHPCTFCAIPSIRGRRRSRAPDSIVREAEGLLAAGFRELTLVSQDTTAYGKDRGGGAGLPELLGALGRIGGRFWIRVMYGFPTGISDALLETMAATPQVCRYLDVPIQHSHPDILRAMRRGTTASRLAGIVRRARAHMPDITLRTTCLVGFPGETERHFRHLLDFAADMQFDHLGAFVFSPEEGTPAAGMPRRPRRAAAAARRERLLALQAGIVARKAAALAGKRATLLLESPAGGRTARQAPEIDGVTRVSGMDPGVKPGAFVDVRYSGADGYDMLARAAP